MRVVYIVGGLFIFVFVVTVMFCIFGPFGGMAAFFLLGGTLLSFTEERRDDEEEFIQYPAREYGNVGVEDHKASPPVESKSVRREDSMGPQ